MLVFTLLLPTICFADTDDYVHADFYRGLVGLKKQVDEINRDLRLLENATLSNAEVNRRLARIEQDIDAVKTLYNEATRNLANTVLTLTAILVAVISAVIAWMNHIQSTRTQAVKNKAEQDLEALKEATDQDLLALRGVKTTSNFSAH